MYDNFTMFNKDVTDLFRNLGNLLPVITFRTKLIRYILQV